jgi:hypothetical protein
VHWSHAVAPSPLDVRGGRHTAQPSSGAVEYVPGGHGAHTVPLKSSTAPGAHTQRVPLASGTVHGSAHSAHSVAPALGWYGQASHAVAPLVAALVPGRHMWHPTPAAGAYVPGAHSAHTFGSW